MKSSTRNVCLFLILAPILILGLLLRVGYLDTTGLEVDEVSNYEVAANVLNIGYPAVKPEFDGLSQIYLFHPPMGYQLMAFWFQLTNTESVTSARNLNVVASMLVLVLVFCFSRSIGMGTALLATFFLAADCWVVMINRMNYLENAQLILIVLGIWLYRKALSANTTLFLWCFAGLTLGLAIIYKHIGVFLVPVIIANWIITRKNHLGHLIILSCISIVVTWYISTMSLLYGQIFFDQQLVQFYRLVGVIPSRGINFGPMVAIQVIVDRYWIFVTTIVALIIGSPLVLLGVIRNLIKRPTHDTVTLSWAIGGLVFAAISGLKSPHYLILWLVPLYIFLAEEITRWAKGKKLLFIPVIVVLFGIASFFTWHYRFTSVTKDTLKDTAAYINKSLPSSAIVVTESYVGALINQPYMRIDLAEPTRLLKADYIAIYTSTTAKLSDLPEIIQLADRYCNKIVVFDGFKDNIVLCKIDHAALLSISVAFTKK